MFWWCLRSSVICQNQYRPLHIHTWAPCEYRRSHRPLNVGIRGSRPKWRAWESSEWVIKFNGLSEDSGQRGPYSPYKLTLWWSGSRGSRHSTTLLSNRLVYSLYKSLTHWGRDKMAAISQTIFSNAFSWMKRYKFRLSFHWSLFPRV